MRGLNTNTTQFGAVVLSTLLVVSIVGVVAFAPVAAEHPEDAPDYTEEANFTISAVSQSDHYPGEDEASMRYWAAGEDAFRDQDAEEGVFIDYIIIDADWIDYSECDVDNTAAFGIDRGNNNSGTQYDEDLVVKQKEVDFRDDGITIEFYNHEDLGGDPPYMAPEDAIVAEQGENSAGGGCLEMTEEEGWYRIDGFLNGTVADNGQDEEPSEDAGDTSTYTASTWFYICDCESEEEAREELGDPPGETSDAEGEDDGEATPGGEEDGTDNETAGEETPDEEATPGGEEDGTDNETAGEETPDEEATPEDGADNETVGEETPDEEATPEAEETADEEDAEEAEDRAEENETDAEEEPPAAENETGAEEEPADDGATPTADDGPGFGAVAALVALLASALLLNRRR